MNHLNSKVLQSPPSTFSGIIMLGALATIPLQSHANYFDYSGLTDKHILAKKTSQSSSSVYEFKSEGAESMLVRVFERMSKDSMPLDEDFARVLSEDILDLF